MRIWFKRGNKKDTSKKVLEGMLASVPPQPVNLFNLSSFPIQQLEFSLKKQANKFKLSENDIDQLDSRSNGLATCLNIFHCYEFFMI